MALFGALAKKKNLEDLASAATARTNLGFTASIADLNATASLIDSITVVAANAAANTIDVVITALDPDGVAIANPVLLWVWLSDAATGLGGSSHTHSTAPSFTVGEEIVEHITNDFWLVLTTAAATCTLRLVDTGNENQTINASNGSVFGQDTTVAGDWS